VLENPFWLQNLFDCLTSMFREAFLADKNKILLNFIMNQGRVFSFLCLCLNFCIGCKTNVVEGQFLLGFHNAFAFTLYSKMFPPFIRHTLFVAFFNGGYNFSLRRFLSESTTLSHPFFQCSLIHIVEFLQ